MYFDEMVHTCILLDETELDVKKLDEVCINLIQQPLAMFARIC